jgi:type VI secretion system protein ImpA
MASIDQLLVPVSDHQPCGEDLSFSREVDAIAKARLHDDPSLEQGEWVVALREADWPKVASQCAQLIQFRSKDLKLAVWLAEASAQTQQFRGLGDGLVLLTGLCSRFWESVHPLPEGGSQEQRSGNLAWLLGRIPMLIKQMPLTEDGEIALADFDAARQRAQRAAPDDSQPTWGATPVAAGPTVAELDAQRRQNSPEFTETLLRDAQYCLSSLRTLEQVLDERLGNEGPSFSAAREALQHAIDFIGLLAPAAGEDWTQPIDGPTQADPGAAPPAAIAHAGGLQTRSHAIAQLRQVAEFFRRTEPHSPVAYLASKAANWADTPLHLWLRAVVQDPAQLARLDDLLGTTPHSQVNVE